MPFTEDEDANGWGTLIQRYFLEGRFRPITSHRGGGIDLSFVRVADNSDKTFQNWTSDLCVI